MLSLLMWENNSAKGHYRSVHSVGGGGKLRNMMKSDKYQEIKGNPPHHPPNYLLVKLILSLNMWSAYVVSV